MCCHAGHMTAETGASQMNSQPLGSALCCVLCLQVTTADWERSDKINPTWWRRGLAWWRRGLSRSLALSLRAWSLCDLDCVNKDLL